MPDFLYPFNSKADLMTARKARNAKRRSIRPLIFGVKLSIGDIPVAVRAVFENLNDPGPLGKGWHDESGRNQRCERRSCARKPN